MLLCVLLQLGNYICLFCNINIQLGKYLCFLRELECLILQKKKMNNSMLEILIAESQTFYNENVIWLNILIKKRGGLNMGP